jgi:hypothetical protein
MKFSRVLYGALSALLSVSVSAQSIDSLEVIHIRELALELYPLQHQRLTEVFGLHDRMPSKDKPLLERYDSLTRDSVFMQSPAFRTVAIDRALLAMSKGNAQAQFGPLKSAFGDVQLPEGLSPYHQEVSAVLLEFALAAEDYATAYRMLCMLRLTANGRLREMLWLRVCDKQRYNIRRKYSRLQRVRRLQRRNTSMCERF